MATGPAVFRLLGSIMAFSRGRMDYVCWRCDAMIPKGTMHYASIPGRKSRTCLKCGEECATLAAKEDARDAG
jgi:hypothetical protein